MRSGIDCVLDMTNFDRWLEWADLVVTGEGRTDWQSSFGKVMQGIGDRCARKGVPVVGLSGSLGPGYETIYEHGIDSLMTTVDGPMGLDEAMSDAVMLYQKAAVRMFHMIRVGMRVAPHLFFSWKTLVCRNKNVLYWFDILLRMEMLFVVGLLQEGI